MPQLSVTAVPPGKDMPLLAQRHCVRAACVHHHDLLVVQMHRQHPGRGELVFGTPMAQLPIAPGSKGEHAAAFGQCGRVNCTAGHHHHPLFIKEGTVDRHGRPPVALVS